MLWLFILLLSMMSGIDNLPVAQTNEVLVNKFLPQNAKVETLRIIDPMTKTETKALAAKVGRMKGKGNVYLAFIYSRTDAEDGQPLGLRVVQNPEGRSLILDHKIPGTFLWMQNFKTNGFQVFDVNGDGDDEIVTISSEGGSLGAYLDVLAVRPGKLESVLSKPRGYDVIGGYKIDFETRPDGKYRIIIYGKWTETQNSTIDIYEWNGRQFVPSNREFPHYYNAMLDRVVRGIYSPEPTTASWRVTLTTQVVGIYINQRRYRDAIRLCQDVLRIIDDPRLTIVPKSAIKEGATTEERNRVFATWEVNKVEARAVVYRLLGDTYKVAGNVHQAQNNYKRAEGLEAEAKQRASQIPH